MFTIDNKSSTMELCQRTTFGSMLFKFKNKSTTEFEKNVCLTIASKHLRTPSLRTQADVSLTGGNTSHDFIFNFPVNSAVAFYPNDRLQLDITINSIVNLQNQKSP